ncbi:PpiC-type peptidyl-prolyl cis-trans isomerase [Candidatus Sulfobium mesophilum]|uniref:PpiC-type peptidyl-prolyl cis-trans isomerase n=1 Tax=Candidatus Sulfobium mesophilum TaxID=2016548 RepID=A0A2U3QFF7_9BACT|nr:PpiC-type peptidyl-prolyl cis-trans isomerase [Candidatus Sulfobium mesophilum]
MKMLSRMGFFVVFVVCLAFGGNAFAEGEDVLAAVGNEKITLRDFQVVVSSYSPEKQKYLAENPASKKILLDRMVQVKALAMTAKAKGMDKDPKIKSLLDYYTDEILSQELLARELAKVDITEKDMKDYYAAHKDSFKAPEMVRARRILVKVSEKAPDEERTKAKKKAEEILARVNAGENFAKLAAEVSDDKATKDRGGDLGYVTRGKMPKATEDAVFSLRPGEVSGLVETQVGYEILKVDEKDEGGVQPFDYAKDKIRKKLTDDFQAEKRKDIVVNAMKEVHVEIHPELIK